MSTRPPRFAALAVAAGALLFVPLAAAPAHAADDPGSSGRSIPVTMYDRHTVQNKVKTANYTNKSQIIGDCMVHKANATCAITHMNASSRSIALALGASRATVSAGLNISSGSSETVSIQCTSPRLPKNGRFRAWPRGDKFTYKIKKQRIVSGAVATTSTSGTLTAFNPKKNTMTCG